MFSYLNTYLFVRDNLVLCDVRHRRRTSEAIPTLRRVRARRVRKRSGIRLQEVNCSEERLYIPPPPPPRGGGVQKRLFQF